MENVSLFLSLAIGVAAVFALFFAFYKVLGWDNKLSALLTILIVMGIYAPFGVIYWAGMDVFAIHFAFYVMSGYGLGIITSHRKLKAGLDAHMGHVDPEPGQKGWFHWGPAIIVCFFLTLAVVDSIIITLASKGASSEFMAKFLPEPRSGSKVVSAFPGAVSNDYQEKYDQFNNYLRQLVTQRERGWEISNGWQQKPVQDQSAVFSIDVKDKEGNPVGGAIVEAKFLRPGDSRLDQTLTLSEHITGSYGNTVTLPAPGMWNVVLTVIRNDEKHQIKGTTQVDPRG
ncbi:MAG: FixH family protein [Thiolinea sp.]